MAALSEIEKLEARYAENPDGRYFAPLADAYRKAGRVDDALQMVQTGLAKHPDYLSAHIVLGRCFLDKKDDAAAQNALQNVLALDAENIIALKSLAEIAERQGKAADARRWLQRLLTVDAMNEEAAADLERLGGPLGEGEAAAPAPLEAGAAQSFEMLDLAGPETPAAPAAPAPPEPAVVEAAAAAAPASPPAPEPPALPRPSFTESPTTPMPAFAFEPTSEPPPPLPPAAEPPPFTLEPTASPPLERSPVAPLHEFQSMSFEAPLDLPPLEPELERTSFEPAEVPPAAPVEGFTDFDDKLAWGAGERMSHAIRAEDVAAAEHAAAETAAPIEFIAPPEPEETAASLDLAAMEIPEEKVELPARSTGAIEVDIGALDLEPPESAPAAPAEAEAPHVAHDLPLIMPEDVTPADELRRPSAKQVATVSPEPDGEGAAAAPAHEPLATETMGDLYLQQGLRSEAADVYRRILERHPGDTVVQGKLAAIESPPALGALAMGVESVGAWLRRIAKATLGAPAPAPAPPPPGEPTPMDQAFEAGEVEAPPAPEPPVEASAAEPDAISGAPARQASEALSLEQIFGTPAPAAAPPPAPPSGPHALGASFDEFFGAGAPVQESVRPKDAPAPRQSEDDLSAFTAWLHGLKR